MKQGLDEHSLILMRHSSPVNPAVHSHMNQFLPLMHLPPFKQGFGLQLSLAIGYWHLSPSKPPAQGLTEISDRLFVHVGRVLDYIDEMADLLTFLAVSSGVTGITRASISAICHRYASSVLAAHSDGKYW